MYGKRSLPEPKFDEAKANESIEQLGDIFDKLKTRFGVTNSVDDNFIVGLAQQIRNESMQMPELPALVAGQQSAMSDMLSALGLGGGLVAGYGGMPLAGGPPPGASPADDYSAAEAHPKVASCDSATQESGTPSILYGMRMLYRRFGEGSMRKAWSTFDTMMTDWRTRAAERPEAQGAGDESSS